MNRSLNLENKLYSYYSGAIEWDDIGFLQFNQSSQVWTQEIQR